MAKSRWIGNYYVGNDGIMAKNQWVGDYYVDGNGLWQPSGWIYNGQWLYRHYNGTYTTNDFEVINGQTYYFDGNGYMLAGWQVINNNWYYFNGSGAMVKNACDRTLGYS